MFKKELSCRVCHSGKLEYFQFDHEVFNGKKIKNCKDYFCLKCKCISHFYEKKINLYKNYRYQGSYKINDKVISPPISLPWSDITFRRAKHIISLLKKNKIRFKKILDYGGYSGLTLNAINQYSNCEGAVADFNSRGLKFAKNLGFKIFNLKKKKISGFYDLILMSHVIEHLENPFNIISQIKKNIRASGYLYIETPNMFATPLYDPTHLSLLNLSALRCSLENENFSIIDSGYTSTPSESLNYGYQFVSSKEVIYVLCKKKEKNNKTFFYDKFPINSIELKKNLNLNYAKIIFSDIICYKLKNLKKNVYHFFGFIFVALVRVFFNKI